LDDTEEWLYVSANDYVVWTRKEWKAFERAWLKRHFEWMLDRAYEKSGVEAEARPARIDHLLIVDESRFHGQSTSIMRDVLGGASVNVLLDSEISPKLGIIVSHGVARIADHRTKEIFPSVMQIVPVYLRELKK